MSSSKSSNDTSYTSTTVSTNISDSQNYTSNNVSNQSNVGNTTITFPGDAAAPAVTTGSPQIFGIDLKTLAIAVGIGISLLFGVQTFAKGK